MPTTDLTNSNISETYKGVLHFRGEQLPTTGQVDVFDGIGNKTSIKIGRACQGVTVCGPFKCDKIMAGDWEVTKQNVIDLIYPVGSLFYTSKSDSPSIRFPGTTWRQVAQGRFLVGVGEGVDSRGERKTFGVGASVGEYSHTLTVPEMPAHSHSTGIYSSNLTVHKTKNNHTFMLPGGATGTNAAGGGQSHNNVPPAYGLYVFERTT